MDEQEDKDINIKIKNILHKSNLSFDETKTFFDGLQYLPLEDKENFISMLEEDPELIYPLYINFKAKLKSLEEDDTGRSWDQIVEDEIKQLEEHLNKKN
ncbi:MAG: hypothetical protein KBD12_01750 [Candidatus Pacebacteria bacterium]|nr:hypothetical protein [Candidatus Paceibacterota bacterium]